jgi:hypothetical protein
VAQNIVRCSTVFSTVMYRQLTLRRRISLTCEFLLAFRKECTDIENAEDRKISLFHQQNIFMWDIRGRTK